MWEINSNSQAFTAVLAVGVGVFLCLFYDVLRAIRDYKRPKHIIVFIFDVLIFALYAVAVFSFLQLYSNGEPRMYILIFMGMGFVFCRVTVSYYAARLVKLIARKFAKITGVAGNALVVCVLFFERILVNMIKKPLKRLKNTQKTLEKQ